MKKYVLTGMAALAMSTAAIANPTTNAADGLYGAGFPMEGNPATIVKAVVSLSGACSGSFEIKGALDAALWKVRGTNTAIDAKQTLIGIVNILEYQSGVDDENQPVMSLIPVMAGNFGSAYSTSITRSKKGETVKISGSTDISGADLYAVIEKNQSKISCAGGSFENVVAKYPVMGPAYGAFMPFEQGAAQYLQKSGKVTFQLTNNDPVEGGKVVRSGEASYKQTVAIAGAFPSTGTCKLKGTLDAPTSVACAVGKPINVKVSIKAAGIMKSDASVIGLLFDDYAQ